MILPNINNEIERELRQTRSLLSKIEKCVRGDFWISLIGNHPSYPEAGSTIWAFIQPPHNPKGYVWRVQYYFVKDIPGFVDPNALIKEDEKLLEHVLAWHPDTKPDTPVLIHLDL